MFSTEQYELLDFGAGRKLERFGPFVLDRPAPAAESAVPARLALWKQAEARYRRISATQGVWEPRTFASQSWNVIYRIATVEFQFQLKPTPFGHVGLFAEQAENWQWIAERVTAAARSLKLLNLFAYTGGSTLAAAAAGAEVVHLDAAKNVVAWARRNAELSGLNDAPIRWIAEDARKFVLRELRRGNRYDAVILDPPSYGHGARGQVWKLEQDLPALLADCVELTGGRPELFLLSCHSPGFGTRRVRDALATALPDHAAGQLIARPLELLTADGRRLDSGVMARVSGRAG